MPALDQTPKKFSPREFENRPINFVSEEPSWLFYQMEQDSNLLLIDCRPFSEYCQAHIEGAINLAISDLMLRRLKKGNMPLSNLLNSDAAKKKFSKRSEVERIVVCDSFSRKESLNNSVVLFLLSTLSEDNRVCLLEGKLKICSFIFFWTCLILPEIWEQCILILFVEGRSESSISILFAQQF